MGSATRVVKATPGQTAMIGGDEPAMKTLEQIECEYLAAWMVKNGCAEPRITQKWLDAARRLRELDGRTHEQVMRCIDWCQADEFWQANIHSMTTLRAKYDTLRMQAMRKRRRPLEARVAGRREARARAAAEIDGCR